MHLQEQAGLVERRRELRPGVACVALAKNSIKPKRIAIWAAFTGKKKYR